jgi:hypothetical protein
MQQESSGRERTPREPGCGETDLISVSRELGSVAAFARVWPGSTHGAGSPIVSQAKATSLNQSPPNNFIVVHSMNRP